MHRYFTALLLSGLITSSAGAQAPSETKPAETRTENASAAEREATPGGASHPAEIRITRAADLATLNPSADRYVVRCKILSNKMTIPVHAFIVRDGERVTVTSSDTKKQVVATMKDGDATVKITREFVEGLTLEVTVLGLGDGQVLVDASARAEGHAAVGRGENLLTLATVQGRLVRKIRCGETASADFMEGGKWHLEVRVEKAGDKSQINKVQASKVSRKPENVAHKKLGDNFLETY